MNVRVTSGQPTITLANAKRWQQDNHLGRYTMTSIFKEEETVVMTAVGYNCDMTTNL